MLERLERSNLFILHAALPVHGILPNPLVTVVDITWYGTEAVELTYKDAAGHLGHELLYRDRESSIEIAAARRPSSFDGDGARFRLDSEADRIRLAYHL